MSWWRRRRVDPKRWVVLDVESSGLDPQRDRLLAIAAVALQLDGATPRIVAGDSFEVLLRQRDTPVDRANILLHGIGVGAQSAGMEPREALEAFERWAADSPLFGFHVAFDEALIQRAMKAVLGRKLRNAWLDLAPIAEVLEPGTPCKSLDDWMAHFGIHCAQRHQAAADTWATAELLQKLWPRARAQVAAPDFAALEKVAAQRRWLERAGS
jgi:DNA polymerase-3 subunit epsilon